MATAYKNLEAAPELAGPRHLFSADDYLRMVEGGILAESDRVELVGGEILEMTPQSPEHAAIKDDLAARLREAYRDRDVYVSEQRPFRAGPLGLPEPDVLVLRGRPRDYMTRHAEGADALLVVEVAKTSKGRDRKKAADYARGGVPIYWILDLDARTLDVHSEPDPERALYRRIETLVESDEIAPPTLEARWKLTSLLP
jgi:Uma2 family endonuclease